MNHSVQFTLSMFVASCYVIANVPWKDQVWPSNQALPGVYVLFGHHQSDVARLGAYIGKSSLNHIGKRFYEWLRPHRATDVYLVHDRFGEPFVIEAIVAIGFRDPGMRAFASALEEFIIAGVRERIYLLNALGNSKNVA
jgi:hypothetical protein